MKRGGKLFAGLVLASLWFCASCYRTVNPGTADSRCGVNLIKVRDAMILYANAHGGRYPDTLSALVDGGLIERATLVCPLDPQGTNSYVYFGKGVAVNDPGSRLLVADNADRHHNGRMGLFSGQQVRLLTNEELGRIRSGQSAITTQPSGKASPGS